MLLFKSPILLLALIISFTTAAVVNPSDEIPLDDIIVSTLSPQNTRMGRLDEDGGFSLAAAVNSIDAATADMAKSVREVSPALSPVLTAGAVSYVAYVALSMAVPSAVKSLGLPSLDEFDVAAEGGRSLQSSNSATSGPSTLMERLTAQLFKNIFRKTEFAGALMSSGGNIMASSVSLIKSFTKFLRSALDVLRLRTDSITSALNSVCFQKYVCKTGQLTRANFPAVGMLLKNIRSHTDDDFAHALIDGVTGGNCNEIFNACVW